MKWFTLSAAAFCMCIAGFGTLAFLDHDSAQASSFDYQVNLSFGISGTCDPGNDCLYDLFGSMQFSTHTNDTNYLQGLCDEVDNKLSTNGCDFTQASSYTIGGFTIATWEPPTGCTVGSANLVSIFSCVDATCICLQTNTTDNCVTLILSTATYPSCSGVSDCDC